jgi:hypothetical protein
MSDVCDEEVDDYVRTQLQLPRFISLENDEFCFWTKLNYFLHTNNVGDVEKVLPINFANETNRANVENIDFEHYHIKAPIVHLPPRDQVKRNVFTIDSNQLKENIDLKQYYNYTSEPYYLNINKYIDKDETDNKYLSTLEVLDKFMLNKLTKKKKKLGFDKLTILKRNYDSLSKDVQSQLQIAVKPSQIPIIKKSELKVNGHNRFKSDSDETSLVRPYTFFNNSYLNGINVYNFGLYPMQKHPSGTINFSFLNDLNLLIDFNNIQSEEIRVTIIGISYNLFRVMSGYGGLGFDIK